MQLPRDAKAIAKSLRQALAERHIQITLSDSLECVARQFGLRDWNTMAAQLDRPALRLPKGWLVSGSRSQDYEMGLDEAQGCALIRYRHLALADEASGFGTLMQSFRADDYRNQRLEFAAQLKAQEVTGAATIWLRVDAEPGRSIAFDNMETRESNGPLVGSQGWQERSIVLDVPAAATSINFGFYLRGKGSVWGRRFRVATVDASVPVTSDGRLERLAPTNLDFNDLT